MRIKRIKYQNEHDFIYNINHKNAESKIDNINQETINSGKN